MKFDWNVWLSFVIWLEMSLNLCKNCQRNWLSFIANCRTGRKSAQKINIIELTELVFLLCKNWFCGGIEFMCCDCINWFCCWSVFGDIFTPLILTLGCIWSYIPPLPLCIDGGICIVAIPLLLFKPPWFIFGPTLKWFGNWC